MPSSRRNPCSPARIDSPAGPTTARWFGAGGDTAGVVAQLVEQPHPPNVSGMVFVFVGFAVVLALDFIRFRIPNFPLHPAGYALAMNFGLGGT